MFVDLSGKAKPGVRVQVPVWVTQLTTPVSLTIRGSLNDASGYQATATVTAEPPEWRDEAVLALAAPAGDTFSVYIELDTGHILSLSATHHTVRATLPAPRPTSDQTVPCTVVI